MKQNTQVFNIAHNIGPAWKTMNFSAVCSQLPDKSWDIDISADMIPPQTHNTNLDPFMFVGSIYRTWENAIIQQFHGK